MFTTPPSPYQPSQIHLSPTKTTLITVLSTTVSLYIHCCLREMSLSSDNHWSQPPPPVILSDLTTTIADDLLQQPSFPPCFATTSSGRERKVRNEKERRVRMAVLLFSWTIEPRKRRKMIDGLSLWEMYLIGIEYKYCFLKNVMLLLVVFILLLGT
ncbi:hypothetical protein MtrunA17_Chr8g0378661 [Medicago truncatula]|uniref:Transmembrane protein n=1 Tax=Medicago truncatula TaxID=3880 RepID=A0A396GQ09_MEDTR|nr:hypothetical protein MtrunA17_Chr8g0378661 [Medicago truncatula]